MKIKLTVDSIKTLFNELDTELNKKNITGELYVVGGAVMCLAFNARPSTNDVDAYFIPKAEIYKISKKIALKYGLNDKWLNDAVKGFLSDKGDFESFIEKKNLKVYIPTPEYLFAMKCLAMRIGIEFSDESDIRYLLKHLDIQNMNEAIQIVCKYYDKSLIPQKTFYALEELIDNLKIH